MKCRCLNDIWYKQKLSYFLLLILCGCSVAPLIRESDFNGIALGGEIQRVEAIYGEPYEIRELPNGVEEYSYIQRIPCGARGIEQIEYIFHVRKGNIVGKCRREASTSSFQIST